MTIVSGKQANPVILFILFFLFTYPLTSAGQCDILGSAIKEKIASYTAFRAQNQARLNNLLATEASCHQQGAAISGKIATSAAAQTCGAEMDASGMDRQLADIGGKCESHFKEEHELQETMRLQFELVKQDLDEGVAYLKTNQFLQQSCSDETQTAISMAQSFLELEGNIILVKGRSIDGQTNYGKFKDMAQSLHALTQASGEKCENVASALTNILSNATSSAATVPKGQSQPDDSTVTGRIDQSSLPAPGGNPNLLRSKSLTSADAGAITSLGAVRSGPSRPAIEGGRSPASFAPGLVDNKPSVVRLGAKSAASEAAQPDEAGYGFGQLEVDSLLTGGSQNKGRAIPGGESEGHVVLAALMEAAQNDGKAAVEAPATPLAASDMTEIGNAEASLFERIHRLLRSRKLSNGI